MKKYILYAALIGSIASGRELFGQSCTNCGIGSNVPQSKLEIRGCTNDSSSSSLRVTTSDSTKIVFFVRNDKRVGINTKHPNTTLDVRSLVDGGISLINTNSSPNIGFYINSSATSNFLMGVDYADGNKFKIGTSSWSTTRFTIDGSGRVGIGTTSPNSSSILELTSTTQGFLTPRMTSAQRSAISSPATGLLVYQTDGAAGYYYYDGTAWIFMTANGAWSLTGNSGTAAGTNFLGTIDAQDMIFKTENTERMRILKSSGSGFVGINTTGPDRRFDILDGSNPQLRLTYTDGSVYTDFQTNSSGYLYINSTGSRIGIGTNSPSSMLSLEGNSSRTIQMERHTTSNTAGNSLTLLSGGATTSATDKNGGELILSSGTSTGTGTSLMTFKTSTAGSSGTSDNAPSTKMTLLGSGFLGIGTTSPSTILAFGTNTSGQTIQIERESNASNNGSPFTILAGGSKSASTNINGGDLTLSSGMSTGNGSSSLIFKTSGGGSSGTSDAGYSTRMTILGTGNIGVNTTGPDRKFDILDAGNPQLRLTYTDGSVYTDMQTNISGYLYINPSGGRTGIGNSAPSFTMDINGITRIADGNSLYVGGQTDLGTDGLRFHHPGGGNNNGYIDLKDAGDLFFRVDNSNGGTTRMTIKNDGKVGVGTTGPVSTFEIGGSTGMKVFTTTATPYTAGTETVILVNVNTSTINLPQASTVTNRIYIIKNLTNTNCTIDPNGAELIEGASTKVITLNQRVIIVCNGTAWYQIE